MDQVLNDLLEKFLGNGFAGRDLGDRAWMTIALVGEIDRRAERVVDFTADLHDRHGVSPQSSFRSRYSSSQAIWIASSLPSLDALGSSSNSDSATTNRCRSVK